MPPGRGSAPGRKFLTPPCYSQHTVFATLWTLFSLIQLLSLCNVNSVECEDMELRRQRLTTLCIWPRVGMWKEIGCCLVKALDLFPSEWSCCSHMNGIRKSICAPGKWLLTHAHVQALITRDCTPLHSPIHGCLGVAVCSIHAACLRTKVYVKCAILHWSVGGILISIPKVVSP